MSSAVDECVEKPCPAGKVPPLAKRLPVLRDNLGHWQFAKKNQITSKHIPLNAEMKKMKAAWKRLKQA